MDSKSIPLSLHLKKNQVRFSEELNTFLISKSFEK